MMATDAMTGARLLKMDEEEFNKTIKEMTVKDLMETISVLQKEMAKEQENFNSLSSELQNFKERNSRQYKQISKDMVVSQQRLTLLMNRSMKCFAQIKGPMDMQNLNNSSSDSPFRRRNSVKEPKPLVTTVSASTNLQRSKSLLAVNQTAASDLPSSLQAPVKSHLANSGNSFQYSVNVSHVPIIMKTTANGGIRKSLEGSADNVNDRSSTPRGPIDAVTSSKGKENLPVSSATDSKLTAGNDGTKMTGTDCVGPTSGATVGLYVKRKPVQQQRVTTTTNISSSKFLPVSMPPSSPVSESPSNASVSTAALPTYTPSIRPVGTTSISSIANESRFVKPKHVASQSEYVSPLQMAQARKGVSKSQTHIQDTDSSTQGFRGLPSVKLLAQSFGSSTALNTISGSSTNYSSNKPILFASTSKAVYRSNSSLNLSEPQKSNITTHTFISKGSTGGTPEQASHQESAMFTNGNSQQQLTKHSNRVPQSSVNFNINGEPTELEKTRTRLRAVGRDIVAESSNTGVHSAVVAPVTFHPAAILSDKEQVEGSSDESVIENRRVGAYVKRKDVALGKPPNNVQPASASVVTVQSVSPPSLLISSKMTSAASVAPPSSLQTSASLSSHNPGLYNSKSVVNNISGAPKSSASSKTQPAAQSINFQQKQQNQNVTTSSSSTSNAKMSYATLPRKDFGATEPFVSTAAVTIRRAKSKEELQQIEYDTRSNKDLLLKQIQARKREQDSQGDGSNIRAMSSLSKSMPSLLEGSDDFHKGGDGSKSSPIKSSIILPEKFQKVTTDNGAFIDDGIEVEDDDRVSRMNLRDWDPSPVLSELYEVKLMEEVAEDISHQFITMEGLMEKLPMNKRKATLLKTWKRRFFRAKDGWLYYYETSNRDLPSESIQLMGGTIHDIGSKVLGIDDGRGRYLMVRCPTEKEYGQWKVALESQTADNTKATYMRPVLRSPRHPSKNVVVVDLGSCGIRAGILGQQASLPELFFPSLVAISKESGKVVAVGKDALLPDNRQKCRIVQPIRPSNKVDQFNIEVHLMRAIFEKIFHDLNVNSPDFWVMISTPQNLGDQLKKGLIEILVDALKVKGVCMVQQALLSLYSYNATSGIIVDIGHRIEILPIFDGFVIEGGVSRCPYGAQKVQESLTTSLLSNNYKFISTTEQLLVRYIMEKVCYVAADYNLEVEWCSSQPQTTRTLVNLSKFSLPDGAYTTVECDLGRFKSPEGFFNVDMWEMDYPTLHKLIYQAIQTCPMDNRRHVWRAVFLSGGVTMLPGFAERLEKELGKLAPPGVPVEVHAAPQRYHAAFIGACSIALMPQFEGMAISKEEWKKDGVKAFKKWQAACT